MTRPADLPARAVIAGDTGAVSITDAAPQTQAPPFGALVRQWRRRRGLSQLDLGLVAGVSARHISFIETGRSTPSRAMVLRLADALGVPPREQNRLLLAAGLAPEYSEQRLDDPELAPVRAGIAQVLAAYEPYPCLVVDRTWDIVSANQGTAALLDGVSPDLLVAPNALRIALHPDGLAPRIRNLAQWHHHVVARLRREIAAAPDQRLSALLAEIESYPGGGTDEPPEEFGGVAVPLRLASAAGELTFLSMVTTFGTARDLTVAELSIEAFLPADDATAAALSGRDQ
jgi:transcriptional regulator with XRE-family HTH domain